MTQSSQADKQPITAAYWLIALEEEPENATLRAEFDAWLEESPDHAQSWAETLELYDLFALVEPNHADQWVPSLGKPFVSSIESPAPSSSEHQNKIVSAIYPLNTWFLLNKVKAIAGMAVAACLVLMVLPQIQLRYEADYLTATGEHQTIKLIDGSTIHLGPESALAVDVSDTQRRLKLISGEAFFEVTSNPEAPFTVMSGKVRTTVVGTAFNIRVTDDGARVSVREGLVEVSHSGGVGQNPRQLSVGHWIAYDERGESEQGDTSLNEIAAWRQGMLVAQDRSLAEVVEELNRYHRGIILINDSELAAKRVTGVYKLSDPSSALGALAQAHGAEVHTLTPWVKVLSLDSSNGASNGSARPKGN